MKLFRFACLAGCLGLAFVRPASAAIVVLSSLAQEHTLTPGEEFDGTIFLRNSGTETATARVSQTDYTYTADGANDYGTPGTATRSNARWLTPATTLVTIAPQQVVPLNYRGKIPSGAALNGSYWSIIMVENAAGAADANGISTITRYGIQIVTHIGQTGARSVRFAKRENQRDDKGAAVHLDLENDGQRLIFPRLWIELFDRDGKKLGRFGGESVRLYPACSARYRVALPAIPAGTYQVLILADCGGDQMVGMQSELVF